MFTFKSRPAADRVISYLFADSSLGLLNRTPAQRRTPDAAICGGRLVSADAEAEFRFSVPQSLPPLWAIPPEGACHADITT